MIRKLATAGAIVTGVVVLMVRWIEPTPPGGEEPEHPAPVLTLRGEAEGHDDVASQDDGGSDSHESSDDSSGVIIAVVVGVLVLLAILGFVLSHARRDMNSKQD